MANEYAPLAQLKSARNVPPSDTQLDDEFQRALTRASRAIDDRCGRRFYRDGVVSARSLSPHGRSLYRDGVSLLLTPDIATTEGLTINGDAFDSTTAETPREGWPVTSLAAPAAGWSTARFVTVVAEWGWPAIPEPIAEATLLLANRRYMRRDSPEGVSGWGDQGVVRVSRFDPDIEDLVDAYVLDGFGS